MHEEKRKHWIDVWAKSIGNKPEWLVFVTQKESVLSMRCLGCRRMYRCQPGAVVTCAPCGGLQYEAPQSLESVRGTQESKKFFTDLGINQFLEQMEEVRKDEFQSGKRRQRIADAGINARKRYSGID